MFVLLRVVFPGVLVCALAACGSTVAPDGGVDTGNAEGGNDVAVVDAAASATIVCRAADAGIAFPASVAACTSASDCVAAVHGLDCCGSTEIVGINGSQRAAFVTPEMACEARVGFNMCDCLASAPTAQDGRMATLATAIVDCVGGACATRAP